MRNCTQKWINNAQACLNISNRDEIYCLLNYRAGKSNIFGILCTVFYPANYIAISYLAVYFWNASIWTLTAFTLVVRLLTTLAMLNHKNRRRPLSGIFRLFVETKVFVIFFQLNTFLPGQRFTCYVWATIKNYLYLFRCLVFTVGVVYFDMNISYFEFFNQVFFPLDNFFLHNQHLQYTIREVINLF